MKRARKAQIFSRFLRSFYAYFVLFLGLILILVEM